MQKVKKVLAGVVSAMVLAVVGAVPVMAITDICDANSGFSTEQKEAAGCNTAPNKTVGGVANEIIQLVTGLVAFIAVGVVLYGGITYITSTGDAAKVTKAKRAIMYGVVGLVISIMAFAIVRFVPKILGQ